MLEVEINLSFSCGKKVVAHWINNLECDCLSQGFVFKKLFFVF
jgi:predicted double-glycine peptidase